MSVPRFSFIYRIVLEHSKKDDQVPVGCKSGGIHTRAERETLETSHSDVIGLRRRALKIHVP